MGYKRILLKLSGESLVGEERFGYSRESVSSIIQPISELIKAGVQVGIVIGAGNLFRGVYAKELDLQRTPADQMGMLATAMNGIVLSEAFHALGIPSRVMSALALDCITESYNWKKAMHALEKGEVLIFVGGTGHPYFTTDTAAALRASEIGAEALLKATKVDGVYDKDPMQYPDAKRFDRLSYIEVLEKELKVMDATSIALCRENQIKIHVFNLFTEGEMQKVVFSKEGGTLVS